MDAELDAVTAQLHDWTEAALALDEGHFPRELLNELEDIVGEITQRYEGADVGDDVRELVDALRYVETGRLQRRADRTGREIQHNRGLPADFVRLAYRLRGESHLVANGPAAWADW